jgi:TRAP transporter TAXI family solute receptor
MSSKEKGRICFILLIFVLLTILGSNHSFAVDKKALTWGTTATTSGAFTYFVVAAKILNEKIPEINITVRSTGASVHNTRLMEKREIDMGGVDTKTAWEAMQGKGTFEGKPFPDLRLLYVINYTNPLQFVVSEKSGIKDIYGLEGKSFTPGAIGMSAEKITTEIFSILGVRPKLRHASYADALESMRNEMIVGFSKLACPDSSILEIGSVMKIKILSLGDNDINKIVNNSAGLSPTVVPSGMYPGIDAFKTVENQWCDFARKDLPTELAYKIVRTLWENRAEIRKTHLIFVGDRMAELALTPKTAVFLHPGAIKFYRELGYTVPKSLVPPEMGEK